MIPKNYVCDGQINLWDYLGQMESKPEKPKIEPNDSICEGCKWREWKTRRLEVDKYGDTWVYCCPGTACANWTHGTPLSLSYEAKTMEMPEYDFQERTEFPDCYNNDFLLHFEACVKLVEDEFGIKFESYHAEWNLPDNPTVYRYFFDKETEFEISEGTYHGTGKKHISIGLHSKTEGFVTACDNLEEIRRASERAFERYKERKNRKKRKDNTLWAE